MTPTAQYQRDAKWDQSRICFNDGQVSAWVDRDGTAHLPPVDVSRLGPNGRQQLSAAALDAAKNNPTADLLRFMDEHGAPRVPLGQIEMLPADEQTMDHVQVRGIKLPLGLTTFGTGTISAGPNPPGCFVTANNAREFFRDQNARDDAADVADETRRDFWIQAAIITASGIVGGVGYALGLAAWDAWVGK